MNLTEIIYLIWNYIGGVILGFLFMMNEPNYLTGNTFIVINKLSKGFFYLGIVLIALISSLIFIRKYNNV